MCDDGHASFAADAGLPRCTRRVLVREGTVPFSSCIGLALSDRALPASVAQKIVNGSHDASAADRDGC